MAFDDDEHAAPATHVDDEYALAGYEDPRLLLTTSHDPSQRLLPRPHPGDAILTAREGGRAAVGNVHTLRQRAQFHGDSLHRGHEPSF